MLTFVITSIVVLAVLFQLYKKTIINNVFRTVGLVLLFSVIVSTTVNLIRYNGLATEEVVVEELGLNRVHLIRDHQKLFTCKSDNISAINTLNFYDVGYYYNSGDNKTIVNLIGRGLTVYDDIMVSNTQTSCSPRLREVKVVVIGDRWSDSFTFPIKERRAEIVI